MRTSLLLIALLAGGMSSANALTSQPAQSLRSLADMTVVPELAARRSGVRSRSGARRAYRNRDYPRPGVIAPPMTPVPRVAPLAPRVGQEGLGVCSIGWRPVRIPGWEPVPSQSPRTAFLSPALMGAKLGLRWRGRLELLEIAIDKWQPALRPRDEQVTPGRVRDR